MKNKKLYVVRGSNDGTLGVYSTKKAAWEKVVDYLGGEVKDYYGGKPINYNRFCKELHGFYTSINISDMEDDCLVDVECMGLNL